MKRVLYWMFGFCLGFALFTVSIQMLVGMATGQNFLDMPWTGSMFLGGILAIVFGMYESLEA